MNRRKFIAVAGASVVGLAGCLDRTDDNNSTSPSPTPTLAPPDGPAGIGELVSTNIGNIAVEEFAAQQSVIMQADGSSDEVVNNTSSQYLQAE